MDSFVVTSSPDKGDIVFTGYVRLMDYARWSQPFLTYLEKASTVPQTCIRFSEKCHVDEGSLIAIADLVAWHNHMHEKGRVPFQKDDPLKNQPASVAVECFEKTDDLPLNAVYAFEKEHVSVRASEETLARKIVLDHSIISQRIRALILERQAHNKRTTHLKKASRVMLQEAVLRGGRSLLSKPGQSFAHMMQTVLLFVSFLGDVLFKSIMSLRLKSDFPISSLLYHLYHVGFLATPIIALISFLIGMVLTYQGINQLERFGAEIYTIDFLTVGVFREIGVLLTAVVVAGRSASAFTAHIGTMSLNQELDAMAVMRLDAMLYLVIPRVFALLISLPLLVFLSDITALVGGMLTTFLVIDVSPLQFLTYLQRAFTPATFWVGMSKAPLFALLISLVGCFRGMQVRASAESVGRLTTTSVVESIFLVIVANAFMSLVFSYLKI